MTDVTRMVNHSTCLTHFERMTSGSGAALAPRGRVPERGTGSRTDMLRAAGLVDVDCCFQSWRSAVFAGWKPA